MTKARLNVVLDDLLSGEGKLRYTSRIPLIFNEHAPVRKDIMLVNNAENPVRFLGSARVFSGCGI